MSPENVTGAALKTLLEETFRGSKVHGSWYLDVGTPGLIEFLRSLSADDASQAPGVDRSSIAAHSAHVCYHLELISRLLAGDKDVFAKADWKAAWKQQTVDSSEWRLLVDRMELLANEWISYCEEVQLTDEMMLTGSLGSVVHFAYHFGAMKQILLDVRQQKS